MPSHDNLCGRISIPMQKVDLTSPFTGRIRGLRHWRRSPLTQVVMRCNSNALGRCFGAAKGVSSPNRMVPAGLVQNSISLTILNNSTFENHRALLLGTMFASRNNILIIVSTSFFVTTSKALVTRSDALVPSLTILNKITVPLRTLKCRFRRRSIL